MENQAIIEENNLNGGATAILASGEGSPYPDYDDQEDEEYSLEERKEMEAFYEDSIKNFKEGEIISGHILTIDKESVLIDVGYKSEGSVPLWEFESQASELKVGDTVEVFLEKTENNDGVVVLSKEKANKIKIWDEITKAHDSETTIKGTIVSKTKGGLTVDIGLKAFLPGSQIDVRPIKDMDSLLGQKMELRVIKMDKKRSNIVLSRRIILEKEREANREKLVESLQAGKILEGIVKNITDYGAFVDLGGIDGLLHIIDMSWGRINHPSELFAIGDKIKVVILKYEEDGKVSLGYKQLTENPWEKIDEKFATGSRIKGKVVNIADYGAFIELEEGVEGLVHITDMSWNKYLKHPSKIVAIGDIVEAEILNIDKEKKKISLGMKQVEQDPWSNIEEKYPERSQVDGTVRNITNFGVFVELEDGVDGLIHISDMSWTQKIKHPSELVKKRENIKAVVLNVDKDNKRISLGIKQLDEDPWLLIPEKYQIGQTVNCKIVKITNFGAFAEVTDNIEGLIHISQLSSDRVKDPNDVVTIGDEVTAKVIKVDLDERKLGLSIKAFTEDLDVSEIAPEADADKESKADASSSESDE